MLKVSSVILLKGPHVSFYKTSTISFFIWSVCYRNNHTLPFNIVSYFHSGGVLLLESKWPIMGKKTFDI